MDDETKSLLNRSQAQRPRRRSSRFLLPILLLFLLLTLYPGILKLGRGYNIVNPHPGPNPPALPIDIAIIGAGPSGVFAASRLRRLTLAWHRPVNVVLFERKASVGGRLAFDEPVFPFDDPKNQWSFTAEQNGYGSFAGKLLEEQAEVHGVLEGLHDGRGSVGYAWKDIYTVTRPSSSQSWKEWAVDFWRFGWATRRARDLGDAVHASAQKIHTLKPQEHVSDIVRLLEFEKLLAAGARDLLDQKAVANNFIDEILASEVGVQSQQSLDEIHGLDVAMAAYRADTGKSTEGGNLQKLLAVILDASGVDLRLSTEVTKVDRVNETKWMVTSEQVSSSKDVIHEQFDVVIHAAPIATKTVSIKDPDLRRQLELVSYQPSYITWVATNGTLNTSLLHSKTLPNRIIAAAPEQWQVRSPSPAFLDIRNHGVIQDRSNEPAIPYSLYRFTSCFSLSHSHIQELLAGADIKWSTQHEIKQAHRNNSPNENVLLPFCLDDKGSLWYPPAIESILQSADASAWAGWNVASLAVESLRRNHFDL